MFYLYAPDLRHSFAKEDALVDNGAAAPKLCLHPWRCAQQQPPVAYFPPAKPLQWRRPPSTTRLFGSARPKRRILKGLQLRPPGTTISVSGEINCLLHPPAGGSSRQNQDKIGCSTQAVLKVVSSPVRFWERGARCFVGRFMLGLDEAAAFLEDR